MLLTSWPGLLTHPRIPLLQLTGLQRSGGASCSAQRVSRTLEVLPRQEGSHVASSPAWSDLLVPSDLPVVPIPTNERQLLMSSVPRT